VKRFFVSFTDGSATAVDAKSEASAKNQAQGSPNPALGTPRKVKAVREIQR
jgi:hypothetical protein